jgi:hypothetical protein
MSEFATFRTKRRFADFTAQVTVIESHNDEVTLTDHPVEQGAPITDHAYKNPAQLTLVVGWSNSGSGGQTQGAAYVRDVYERLLKVQGLREPFDVTTGKRNYSNMVIVSLATETDKETENSLIVSVGLREVRIVRTQAVNIPSREVQAEPAKTAETTDAGAKQAVPAPNANVTALKRLLAEAEAGG